MVSPTWRTTTTRSNPPATPEQGYHLSVDLTDKAIEFIDDVKAIAPDRPVFLYYALGAAHAPHHVPKEWADRYQGKFDMGYEKIREQVLARQIEMGIVPAEHRAAADQPAGDARHAHRSGRQAVPGAGLHQAVGQPVGRTRSGCSPGWPRCTPGS